MVENSRRQGAERFRGKKPVQVVLTTEEFDMVRRIASEKGISVPNAIRRAIHLQEWTRQLREGGAKNLVLGVRNASGKIETAIPVPLLPTF